MEFGLLVSKKKIVNGFFYHIWASKPSGHVTNIIITYVPKILHTKFGHKRSSGF